jgi:hypothetical protein
MKGIMQNSSRLVVPECLEDSVDFVASMVATASMEQDRFER